MADGDLYAVDGGSGYVSIVDPLTGDVLAKKYVASRLTQGIVDGNGGIWVESQNSGALAGLRFTHRVLQLTTVDNSVVAPGNQVELAAVNGVPAVVDESRDLFFTAPRGVPGAAVAISLQSGTGQAAIAPSITGPVVPSPQGAM